MPIDDCQQKYSWNEDNTKQLNKEIELLRKEIERLKGLIEKTFFRGVHSTGFRDEPAWQQFKLDNNIK